MTRIKLALRGWVQVVWGQIVREIGYAISHDRLQRRGILIEKLGHGLLYRAHRMGSALGPDVGKADPYSPPPRA
ncbi:hypothetical protein KTQ54_02440 [Komagataeibacter oboediens]|uniref:hypothetical protein n=1 Tax=Komagataeibacter oboediens TaxID=65958 RepID=UPI001C2B8017|nr:hypothetical protein [Komagataeibacter oboediens]MBV0887406.1 hypothetical protein [Komagataeibacter oboediens]MCK9819852.1 hypothetical protein [Komagataeibacter oboediens]